MYSVVTSVALLATAALAASSVPAIPLVYNYGGYPRTEVDIQWGTKAQAQVPTIFDTGSVAFWVYGPNSTINDGSPYHFTEGPCNKTVKTIFNYPASTTYTDLVNLTSPLSYSYGGNGKIVSAYQEVNDTFSFPNAGYPAITNNRVAIANFTVVTQSDDGCKISVDTFDQSILGVAPFGKTANGESGPSFRYDLYDQGRTPSHSFSMWFNKGPASATGQYQGAAIFGAVPDKSNYNGSLVRVALDPPKGTYIGYYVALPTLSVTNFIKPGKPKTIKSVDKSVKRCLLDSGTGIDNLPFNATQVVAASSGLIHYTENNNDFFAYNSSCASIPASAALNFTFAGSTAGKKVSVSVPIRSYARGLYDDIPGFSKDLCGLSISLSEFGSCTFGAPFFTAVFAVFNDDANQIALAQGGVSTDAASGLSAIGTTTPIPKGSDIPGSV